MGLYGKCNDACRTPGAAAEKQLKQAVLPWSCYLRHGNCSRWQRSCIFEIQPLGLGGRTRTERTAQLSSPRNGWHHLICVGVLLCLRPSVTMFADPHLLHKVVICCAVDPQPAGAQYRDYLHHLPGFLFRVANLVLSLAGIVQAL